MEDCYAHGAAASWSPRVDLQELRMTGRVRYWSQDDNKPKFHYFDADYHQDRMAPMPPSHADSGKSEHIIEIECDLESYTSEALRRMGLYDPDSFLSTQFEQRHSEQIATTLSNTEIPARTALQ